MFSTVNCWPGGTTVAFGDISFQHGLAPCPYEGHALKNFDLDPITSITAAPVVEGTIFDGIILQKKEGLSVIILLKGMLPALLCLIPHCSKPHWCSMYGTLFTYICRISHAKFQGPIVITSTNTYQETASHTETHLLESLLGASCAAHNPCNKKHPVASHPLVQFPGSDEDPCCICSTRLSLLLIPFLQLATEPCGLRIQTTTMFLILNCEPINV